MNWNRIHAATSIVLLRTLLLCVNIVFMITGGILFLLGILLRSQFLDLIDSLPEMRSSSPYILMTLGLIIFFIGLFAFWCTITGHIAMLYIYSFIVTIIFLAEILLAVTVIMKKQRYEKIFKDGVREIMEKYPTEHFNAHIDHLQTTFACCGVDSYADWFETTYGKTFKQVPASCCKKALNHTCERKHLTVEHLPNDINTNGCYTTVMLSIKNHYPIVGGIVIAIALVPLIGALLSCGLVRQLGKHRYEPVD